MAGISYYYSNCNLHFKLLLTPNNYRLQSVIRACCMPNRNYKTFILKLKKEYYLQAETDTKHRQNIYYCNYDYI